MQVLPYECLIFSCSVCLVLTYLGLVITLLYVYVTRCRLLELFGSDFAPNRQQPFQIRACLQGGRITLANGLPLATGQKIAWV